MNQLPAHLQKYQAPDVGAALSANLGSTMPPHVSIGGGRFTLIDAANNELAGAWFDQKLGVYVDACIVDVNNVMSRIYFSGAYDNDAEGVRPDCYSDNGIGPSVSASSPQAPLCMPDPTGQHGCKWAVWGSKINANGKKVPACSSKQKVALLIPGYNTLFLLAIPPNSHGPLREYVEKCKGNGINMADVITRISFVPGVQGTLQFQGVTWIDEPTAALRQAAYAEKKTDALVGRTDMPRPAGTMAAPAEQVQQPNPLQPQLEQHSARTVQPVAQTAIGAGSAIQPAASSEPAPAQRRRRRSAAELQEASGASSNGQASQQPPGDPQAPFPHPGSAAGGAQTAQQGSFGIEAGQSAGTNPELSNMLDSFFGN